MALNASIGALIFGYNIGSFNLCQNIIAANLGWGDNKDLYISIMAALMPAGGFFGSVKCGSIADKYGVRKTIMIFDVINILSCLLFIYPHTITFALGRFCTGFTAGIFSVLSPLYISEICPKEIMGKVGNLTSLLLSSGIAISFLMALPLPTSKYNENPFSYYWIAIFCFQGLFAFTQFIIFLIVFKEETPGWLIKHKRHQDALKKLTERLIDSEAIESLEKKNSNNKSERPQLNDEEDIEYSYLDLLLCRKKTSKMMRLGLLINIFQVASGDDAIIAFTDKIFDELGGGVFESRLYTVIYGFFIAFSTIMAIPIIDRFNRKTLIIFGNVGMGLSLFMMGVFAEFFPEIGPFPSLVFIVIFTICFNCGIGPICWIYLAEIVPAKGMGICISLNCFIITTSVFTFPLLVNFMSIGPVFFFYSSICAMCVIYVSIEFVETRGLENYQIKQVFAKHNN